MKLEFDWDWKESETVQRHHYWNSSAGKFRFIVARFGIAIVPFIFLNADMSHSGFSPWKLCLCIALSVVWIFVYPILLKNRLPHTPYVGKGISTKNHAVIELTEKALVIINNLSKEQTDWAKIVKLEENDAYYYIFITDKSFYPIPKEKLKKDELDELDKFLKRKISQNNKL